MSRRIASVDALRGLAVAAMLLVNNPGDWGHVYAPLEHAAWHGFTPTDLIFPFFLFIVGVSAALALGPRVDAGAPLGPVRAGRIAAASHIPVYALGGIVPQTAARLPRAFSGIAAITGLL